MSFLYATLSHRIATITIQRKPIKGCNFFFNDTATTEIYTLSLHDALPICGIVLAQRGHHARHHLVGAEPGRVHAQVSLDRKSTRLNSSHSQISYAVFCLKKKKKTLRPIERAMVMHSLCSHNVRPLHQNSSL